MTLSSQPQVKWLKFLLALLLALGIFFRFADLDRKPYWHDETFTSLRISGHSSEEVFQQLYTGQPIDVEAFQPYQRPSHHGAIATVQRLAEEEPQHPPLYYGLAHLWTRWFGSSVTTMRNLPALISLLGFPAIYWMALELFNRPSVSWMALALYAVSPLYIRYAQEARQYSLWMVIIMLSCTMLLRAIRLPTRLNWLFYALTVTAGLYCHLFSGLVFLGHGIYVAAIARFRLKSLIPYLLASLLGILAFLPWLQVMWLNRDSLLLTTDWTKTALPLPELLKIWSFNFCHLFATCSSYADPNLIYKVLRLLVLFLTSLYFILRKTSKRQWLFILLFIGLPMLALQVPDLIWGGRRSTSDRYLLPSYLGIQLAVAYLLTIPLSSFKSSLRRLGQLVVLLIISISIFSNALDVGTSTWWGWSQFDVEVSHIINRVPQPLVISDMPPGVIMPLSHRLNADAKLLLSTEPEHLKIPREFNQMFVYNPSDRLKAAIEQKYAAPELIYQFVENTLVISLYSLKLK